MPVLTQTPGGPIMIASGNCPPEYSLDMIPILVSINDYNPPGLSDDGIMMLPLY